MKQPLHIVSGFLFCILLTTCGNRTQVKSGVERYSPRLNEIKQHEDGYLFFNKGDTINPFFVNIPIKYKVIDGLAIFQGDIVLGNRNLFKDRSFDFQKGVHMESLATEISALKWSDKTVYYFIDRSAERYASIIEAAVEEWRQATDLTFQKITQKKGNHITIIRSDGYSSEIGMVGGEQFLRIPVDPERGRIMHEIGHAIGLWHEHSRKDRNDFINVNYENVEDGYSSDFDMMCCDVNTYSTVYDYGSLMHYPRDAFSKGGNTINPKNNIDIGQRERLSEVDKEGVRKLYN